MPSSHAMSEVDPDYQPSSDSFWEVGQYKSSVKRVEDGFKLCNEFMNLVQERCEIEKAYAKSLKHWSKKWNDLIQKGPEYGTTQAAWRGFLEEADRVSEVHIEVKNDLFTEVHTNVKQWQKENYHRSMVGVIKESKDFDDSFRRAQKPWAKRLSKVIKAKKEYHTCCKTEKTVKVQLANAKGDSSVTPENSIEVDCAVASEQQSMKVKKAQDKADKSERDTELSRDKYKAALSDLDSYNPKYMEEMTEVFEQCQLAEEKRLKFFKDVMFQMHRCLNISAKEKFPIIYDDLHATIEKTESSQDLKWWANTYGTGMAMNWPQFEEYSPELKPINKKSTMNDGGIVLKNVRQSTYTPGSNNHVNRTFSLRDSFRSSRKRYKKADRLSETSLMSAGEDESSHHNDIQKQNATTVQAQNKAQAPVARQPSYDPELNPFGDDDDHDNVNPQNPFGDDWDSQYDLVDDGKPGVPVRALYDYTALEDDELNLKAGDIFHRLSEEDGQGWCKGRKDGVMGLYPANYAEPV